MSMSVCGGRGGGRGEGVRGGGRLLQSLRLQSDPKYECGGRGEGGGGIARY